MGSGCSGEHPSPCHGFVFHSWVEMRIYVVGLGYVGIVTSAGLADLGHEVIGTDSNETRIQDLQKGLCPILEPGLEELLTEGARTGRLRFRYQTECPPDFDLAMLCVGTPSVNGRHNYGMVVKALDPLYARSASLAQRVIVAIRSTMSPDGMEAAIHEVQARHPEARVDSVANPEFLREASAVADFLAPPFLVAGGDFCQGAVDKVLEVFESIPAQKIRMTRRSAAMLKLACNAFHATKVAFANDVAKACDLTGADPVEVFRVFCQDVQLNCSPAYLRPGFAFGGPCLPKDLEEMTCILSRYGTASPLLQGVLDSNAQIIAHTCERIIQMGVKRVAMIGISFKPGTADLRDSPYMKLAENLIRQQITVRFHDPDLYGVEGELGVRLCANLKEALEDVEGVIVAKPSLEVLDLLRHLEQKGVFIFDLERSLARSADSGASTAA